MLVTVYRGVLLYGDSGVGKSSLVNAGLLPLVIGDGRAVERLRVQAKPEEEIVLERFEATRGNALLDAALVDGQENAQQVVFSVDAFTQRVRAVCQERELLLVFDHFEEIVTLFDAAHAESVRQRLVKMLVGLQQERSLPVKCLFVFREDYLGRVKELLAACPELIDQSLRLHPPKASDLSTVIRGPFERYPDRYPREISRDLARELHTMLAARFASGDVSLSEVQTVCLRLWQSERPEQLLEAKGLQGILEDYLDEQLDALTPEMASVAVALLSKMVTPVETRNVISEEDLVREVCAEEGVSRELVEATLWQLDQKSRLVLCELRRDLPMYEIASEFLVPWISARREGLRRTREQRRERRRRRLLVSVAVGSLLLSGLLAGLAAWSLSQRGAARREALLSRREAASATSLALLAVSQEQLEDRLDVSLALALAAYRINPSGQARAVLTTALQSVQGDNVEGILHGETTGVLSVAFSPSGGLLASGSNDGTVRLWDLASRRQLGQVDAGSAGVRTIVFSPDGASFLTGDEDGSVRFWSSRTYRQLGRPIAAGETMYAGTALSPDGRLLAVGGLGHRFSLWSVASHRRLGRPVSVGGPVGSIAFSPNGRLLAIGSYDGEVRLWSVRARRQLGAPFEVSLSDITRVAFSPDGRMLAVLTTELFGQGHVELWDLATHRRLGHEIGAKSGLNSFAFGPAGRTLVGGGSGSTAVWSVPGARELHTTLFDAEPVEAVAISPDEATVASATGELVELSPSRLLRALQVLDGPAPNHVAAAHLAFTEGGRTLIGVSRAGRVAHWDLRQHGTLERRILDTRPSAARCRVLSSNGTTMASLDRSGTIWLWDLTDGRALGRLETSPGRMSESVDAGAGERCRERLALSPDGQTLAMIVGAASERIELWSVRSQKAIDHLSAGGETFSELAFSPAGGTLVSVSFSSQPDHRGDRIRLWDVRRHVPLGGPLAVPADVSEPVVSPDRRTLAFVSIVHEPDDVGGVSVWDLATRRQLGQLPLARSESIATIGLSPDGRTLLTVSGEAGGTEEFGGQLRLWDLRSRKPLGAPLNTGGEMFRSVVFSPAGDALAVLGEEGEVELASGIIWGSAAELHEEVCGLLGQGLTRAEWVGYVPGVPYEQVC